MSCKTNSNGDCSGCGVHIYSIDGKDFDYCECATFREKCDQFDGSVEQFCEIFEEGVKLLYLSYTDIAKHFAANESNVERWFEHKDIPDTICKKFVVQRLKHLVVASGADD